MHNTRIWYQNGSWFGICTCGWTTGAFTTSAGAIAACMVHEDAQFN